MDGETIEMVVDATYVFVSDENLLGQLSQRVPPPSLAMKLVSMLNTSELLPASTLEKLLLVLAVLCGARKDDHQSSVTMSKDYLQQELGGQKVNEQVHLDPIASMLRATAAQSQDLVAGNGLGLILGYLSSSTQPAGIYLAALRVLLALSSGEHAQQAHKNISSIVQARGVLPVLHTLTRSLATLSSSINPAQMQVVLHGCAVLGKVCGESRVKVEEGELVQVVDVLGGQAIDANEEDIMLASVRTLRDLSFNAANWPRISTHALPRLMEILLADKTGMFVLRCRLLMCRLLMCRLLMCRNVSKLTFHSTQEVDQVEDHLSPPPSS